MMPAVHDLVEASPGNAVCPQVADLTRFFRIAPDPMCVIDFEGRFRQLNEAWFAVLGFAPEALVERSVEHLIHPEDWAAFSQAEEAARRGGAPFQCEARFRCQDGSYRRLSWHAVADPEDGCIYATARRTTRKALKRTSARSAKATGTTIGATERDAFARAAKEGLQEPARQITSYLQLMARCCKEELDADAQRFVELAVDAAKYLQQSIRDLATAPQPAEGAGEVVAMDGVFEKALEIVGPAIREADVHLTKDPLPDVVGDPGLLAELLGHLLSNAVRFRRPGVPLRVHIGATRQGDRWRFSVEDNGIGIAPAHRERLFASLRRTRPWEEPSAIGEGLARSMQIVERHHGHIGFESRLRGGSCFYFTLRAA